VADHPARVRDGDGGEHCVGLAGVEETGVTRPDPADIDRNVASLHECLHQYERAMGELGWTMLNVNSRATLDAVVVALRAELRDALDEAVGMQVVAERFKEERDRERAAREAAERELDEERKRFRLHVETMIEPKLLERAESAEADAKQLRERLKEAGIE
jgi:hypothetical protein